MFMGQNKSECVSKEPRMFMWRLQSLMEQKRNQTQRDDTELWPVFLMVFMKKMYLFNVVTQVIVSNPNL